MKDLSLLAIIKENNITNIKQIFSYTKVSDSTIRRNLKTLEEAGYLRLYYGGEIELVDIEDMSLDDSYKEKLNRIQKISLARKCVELIDEGDVIFIDNGTTVRYILNYLKGIDVTVYSNGYNHIALAKENNIDFNIIPGKVLYKEAAIVGFEAIAFLMEMNFDHVFIGANGFEEEHGVTTPNHSEAVLKRVALKRGNKSYIVIDVNKYKVVTKYKVASFSKYPIITLS